jgi:protein-tyrosine-phosphatase
LQDAASLEISSAVVSTSYRVTPLEAPSPLADDGILRVLFVSESGVCRSVLAVAAFNKAAEEVGLQGVVEPSAAASRDYCLGESPDGTAVAAAEKLGLHIPGEYAARQFDERVDCVKHDVILVMDKFTAADCLREITTFDLVDGTSLSLKVRRLGEFRGMGAADAVDCNSKNTNVISDIGKPTKASAGTEDEQDIQDPLYGNAGDAAEAAAVEAAAKDIVACCRGLAVHINHLLGASDVEQKNGLRRAMASWLREADGVDWMVPPLLSARR